MGAQHKTFSILAAFCCSLIIACQDRSVDDHRKEQADLEAARLSVFEGSYRGSVENKNTQMMIGSMEVYLQVVRSVVPSMDNTSTSTQVFLNGNVVVRNATDSKAVIQTASIYSKNRDNNGSFSGVLKFGTAGSTMNISGNIEGDRFVGMISGSDPADTAIFTVYKNGVVNEQIQQQSRMIGLPANGDAYSGSFNQCQEKSVSDPTNCEVPVFLRLRHKATTPEDRFPLNFASEVPVSVFLRFRNAETEATGRLQIYEGHLSLSTQSMLLECFSSENLPGMRGWTCDLTNGIKETRFTLSPVTPKQGRR